MKAIARSNEIHPEGENQIQSCRSASHTPH